MTKHRRCFRLTRHRLLRIKQYTVIALISALSAVGVLLLLIHMLSVNESMSHEAVPSAKTSSIIMNLRALKTGALSWYEDNRSRITLSGDEYILDGQVDNTLERFVASEDFMIEAVSYNPSMAEDIYGVYGRSYYGTGNYVFAVKDDGLYVGYLLGRGEDILKDRLSRRASAVKLVKTDGKSRYDKDSEVYLLVVNLSDQGGRK